MTAAADGRGKGSASKSEMMSMVKQERGCVVWGSAQTACRQPGRSDTVGGNHHPLRPAQFLHLATGGATFSAFFPLL